MNTETILKEVNTLFKECEEIKNANNDLTEHIGLLREELRMAKDAERSAESKKARCQGFLLHQQDIIQKLIDVKEENENLKCKLKQTELTLSMFQNSSIEEQMRADARIQEIKEEYLTRITKVQEDLDNQAKQEKCELLATISEIKTLNSELEKKLEETSSTNSSLQEQVEELKGYADAFPKLEKRLEEKEEEVRSIKAWCDANIDVFHKKLAEQERKHQSELEIWKMAELNRTTFGQVQSNNPSNPYGNSYASQYQPQRPMQGYQPNIRFQEQTATYQAASLVTHYKNVLPRQTTNMVRPLTSSDNYKSEFVSASELYTQNQTAGRGEEKENSGEKVGENKVETNKPKILVPNKKRKLFSLNQNII
ncbi:GRIP and coiled-coil domain-containing protein 2-like [Macrosteles quadrilineatus]|uniref:GRIP and coiled-coil domain-containing protein 2-like n=1 Tax=Macrosteles quadrilineatus TaxID=74068 RepID=UPI0023E0B26A|nr:GRIP and coiled-coil domain-containing protein 2-like [Macrosteles quadrilineatus]